MSQDECAVAAITINMTRLERQVLANIFGRIGTRGESVPVADLENIFDVRRCIKARDVQGTIDERDQSTIEIIFPEKLFHWFKGRLDSMSGYLGAEGDVVIPLREKLNYATAERAAAKKAEKDQARADRADRKSGKNGARAEPTEVP